MLIDLHCHLNSLALGVKDKVIEHFASCGNKLVDSSINWQTSLTSLELAKKHSFIYSALGFHPFSCLDFSLKLYQKYRTLLEENNKVIALGEIGLDFKSETPLFRQEEIFCRWLELAAEKNLPVLIHVRLDKNNWHTSGGYPRILAALDKYFSDYQKVVFHCFSYSPVFLSQILAKKGFVSFSLNLLRKNKTITESLLKCPLENMFLETDSPYMRIGKDLSTPLDLKNLYSYVAGLKGISEKKLEQSISLNFNRVFQNASS